jgi:hypothetical protein
MFGRHIVLAVCGETGAGPQEPLHGAKTVAFALLLPCSSPRMQDV